MTPKLYEGTKRLAAQPMRRGDYNAYRGWVCPADEDPTDDGYLVEYVDGGKSNDSRHAGYISWSPKDVFERSYALVLGADLPPHQQRVLAEKADLDGILSKLDAFILDNPLYRQLPGEEQDRLSRQSEAMAAYSGILGERIDAFSAQAAVTDAATITLPVVDPGPDSLEREIQAKADKAPRVTPDALKAEIVSEHYHSPIKAGDQAWTGDANGQLNTLTFCVLVLRNGFTVIGHSACASPENFNAEIGRRIARENAEREIWPLLGFRLRDQLSAA